MRLCQQEYISSLPVEYESSFNLLKRNSPQDVQAQLVIHKRPELA